MLKDITKKCLEKLEDMIDEDHVEKTRKLQEKAFTYQQVDHIPTVIYFKLLDNEWPDYNNLEIFDDQERMLLSELKSVYMGAKIKDDRMYGIRANYGTAIIASLFGCQIHTFKDVLPCGTAAGDISVMKELVQKGIPDVYGGIAGQALNTVSYFRDVLRDYPKLGKVVMSQLFDIQGTFDNASIIWGSNIFLDLYDNPDLVHDMIKLVTWTIEAVVKEHRKLDGMAINEHGGEWENLGGICLRNDSCINLSGEMYEHYVKPYDKELLSKFNGWIHFCGKAHQWWERLLDIEGLKAINPYQGEFYDLTEMYRSCAKRRIPIVQWTAPVGEKEKEIIKTGFSRITFVDSYDKARDVMNRLYGTGWPDVEKTR